MGALAESTLQAGGEVTGVEVSFFVEQDLQYEGLTHFYVARDLPQRRTKMIELGDAFIAFPGGLGTLEEISEVMSRVALHKLVAPCILYNLDGYYEGIWSKWASAPRKSWKTSTLPPIWRRLKPFWQKNNAAPTAKGRLQA